MIAISKETIRSLQMRLKDKAKRAGKPYEEMLQYYGIERFLYRLSKTNYISHFILKGGLVFYVWDIPLRRPTKDIDFRAYLSNSRENITKVIQDVIAIPAPEDGVFFDADTIIVEETQVDADYEGVSASFTGYLGNSKIFMRIDIGFSDETSSNADVIDYPALLGEFQSIQISGYPKESVISEKFHAMVALGEINSRMKDYYDIWLMSETFEFDCTVLQKAVEVTFKKRNTELPLSRPVALTAEFASANQMRWKTLLSKVNSSNRDVKEFTDIVEKVWIFLEHPLQASISQTKSTRKWIPQKGWK